LLGGSQHHQRRIQHGSSTTTRFLGAEHFPFQKQDFSKPFYIIRARGRTAGPIDIRPSVR
jgi:hypothetical protein